MTTINEYADKIVSAIRSDMDEGVVPFTVRTFGDLHASVDANDYTDQAGVPWGTDIATESDPDGMAIVNAVETEVSRRLAA